MACVRGGGCCGGVKMRFVLFGIFISCFRALRERQRGETLSSLIRAHFCSFVRVFALLIEFGLGALRFCLFVFDSCLLCSSCSLFSCAFYAFEGRGREREGEDGTHIYVYIYIWRGCTYAAFVICHSLASLLYCSDFIFILILLILLIILYSRFALRIFLSLFPHLFLLRPDHISIELTRLHIVFVFADRDERGSRIRYFPRYEARCAGFVVSRGPTRTTARTWGTRAEIGMLLL